MNTKFRLGQQHVNEGEHIEQEQFFHDLKQFIARPNVNERMTP